MKNIVNTVFLIQSYRVNNTVKAPARSTGRGSLWSSGSRWSPCGPYVAGAGSTGRPLSVPPDSGVPGTSPGTAPGPHTSPQPRRREPPAPQWCGLARGPSEAKPNESAGEACGL